MADKKKPWVEPELIVLVRGKPEESVLDGCKTWTMMGGGPSTSDTECGDFGCDSCSAWAVS